MRDSWLSDGAGRELEAIKVAIDEELRAQIVWLEAEGPDHAHPLMSRVYRWFRHYLNSNGRRMHGLAVVLAYRACGGRDLARIYPVAAAFQLYHHHTLVHDDIYDGDDLRRGWPTTHRAFARYLEGAGYASKIATARSNGDLFTTEALRRGTIAAIAYGKIGRALAAHMIGEAAFPAPAVLDVMQALNGHDLFDNAGQLKDVHHEGATTPAPQACLENAWLKTGRLFEVCAYAGARLASGTQSQTGALKTWAGLSALAYQLQDDMEDLVAESEKGQGRGVGRDVAQLKPTYLHAVARTLATGDDAALLGGWRGGDDVTALTEVFDRCGATAAVRQKIAEVVGEAKRPLAGATLAFDAPDVSLMASFTDYFVSPEYWRRGIGRHEADAVALMA